MEKQDDLKKNDLLFYTLDYPRTKSLSLLYRRSSRMCYLRNSRRTVEAEDRRSRLAPLEISIAK